MVPSLEGLCIRVSAKKRDHLDAVMRKGLTEGNGGAYEVTGRAREVASRGDPGALPLGWLLALLSSGHAAGAAVRETGSCLYCAGTATSSSRQEAVGRIAEQGHRQPVPRLGLPAESCPRSGKMASAFQISLRHV